MFFSNAEINKTAHYFSVTASKWFNDGLYKTSKEIVFAPNPSHTRDLVTRSNAGVKPIHYPGPHKLCIIAGGPQITFEFILKFHLYFNTRDRGFLWHTICLSRSFALTQFCTLKLCNETSDAGYTKRSHGSRWPAGHRFPSPVLNESHQVPSLQPHAKQQSSSAREDKPQENIFLSQHV